MDFLSFYREEKIFSSINIVFLKNTFFSALLLWQVCCEEVKKGFNL